MKKVFTMFLTLLPILMFSQSLNHDTPTTNQTESVETTQDPSSVIPTAREAQFNNALYLLALGETDEARVILETILTENSEDQWGEKAITLLNSSPYLNTSGFDDILSMPPWYAGNITTGITAGIFVSSLLTEGSANAEVSAVFSLLGVGGGAFLSYALTADKPMSLDRSFFAESVSLLAFGNLMWATYGLSGPRNLFSHYAAASLANLNHLLLPRFLAYGLTGQGAPSVDQTAFAWFAYGQAMFTGVSTLAAFAPDIWMDNPDLATGLMISVPLTAFALSFPLWEHLQWSVGQSAFVQLGGGVGLGVGALLNVLFPISTTLEQYASLYYLGMYYLGEWAFYALVAPNPHPNPQMGGSKMSLTPTYLAGQPGIVLRLRI
jgi:hypothetical protein